MNTLRNHISPVNLKYTNSGCRMLLKKLQSNSVHIINYLHFDVHTICVRMTKIKLSMR